MSLARHLRAWAYATCVGLIAGCVAVPIQAPPDPLDSGAAMTEGEVRSMVSGGEDVQDVKARLGEPTVNFGPRRVFVYHWTVKKGAIVWLLGGPRAAAAGVEPWAVSHLLLIAFDTDGKVLKAGTMTFKPFDTIAKHVRKWLSSVNLAAGVVGPRPGQPTNRRPLLFVYRLSTSPCPFPTFDAKTFKPSVAVDGVVAGDLAKGEYLAVEIEVREHAITIDPIPYYRFVGQEESAFVQNVRSQRTPVTVHAHGDPDRPIYIQTYLCTGTGKVEMHAEVRDAASALAAMRGLLPAW